MSDLISANDFLKLANKVQTTGQPAGFFPFKPMKTTITPEEFLRARAVGLERWDNAERDRRNNNPTGRRRDWGIEAHIRGALAEFAMAKILGIPWKPTTSGPDTETGDLPNEIQVKSVMNRDDRLTLYEHHPPRFKYLKLYVSPKEAQFMGWIYGHEGKLEQYWEEKGKYEPAYFVPNHKLRSVKSFEYGHPASAKT